MGRKKLMREELLLLRNELTALKECQTRYVVLAVTSAGVIFAYLIPSLEEIIQSNSMLNASLKIDPTCLIPLVIILPLSCIFFNKATTLFRIVGYYQVLEEFHINGKIANKYVGWENSLRLFRECGKDKEMCIKKNSGGLKLWKDLDFRDKIAYFISVFGLDLRLSNKYGRKPQSYWELVYSTFFLMTLLCFVLTFVPIFIWANQVTLTISKISTNLHINKYSILIIWASLSVSIYIFISNLKILYQLEKGFHSYKANYALWKTLLIDGISEENVGADKNVDADRSNFKIQLREFYQNCQKGMILFIVINIVVTLVILLS
jgi:hypothetical protein